MTKTFSFDGRVRSVGFALNGIWLMLKSQHNAWVHAVATVFVVAAGMAFRISSSDWALLILAIVVVWTAEALNTALEHLADVASPDFHPLIGRAKDVAAGAVLISALGAVAIGVMVLGPYVVDLFRDGA